MPHITIQSPCTTLIDSTHYYTKRNYILCSYNLCKNSVPTGRNTNMWLTACMEGFMIQYMLTG